MLSKIRSAKRSQTQRRHEASALSSSECSRSSLGIVSSPSKLLQLSLGSSIRRMSSAANSIIGSSVPQLRQLPRKRKQSQPLICNETSNRYKSSSPSCNSEEALDFTQARHPNSPAKTLLRLVAPSSVSGQDDYRLCNSKVHTAVPITKCLCPTPT